MSELKTTYSAKDLVDRLDQEGLIKGRGGAQNFILSKLSEKEPPLYLKIFAGIGAFIATMFFLAFLFAADIIDIRSEAGMIFFGVVFIAIAIGIKSVKTSKEVLFYSFLIQTSVIFIAIGKILVCIGVAKASNSGWGVTLALFMVTIATYKIYDVSLDRFLSSFAFLLSVLLNIAFDRYQSATSLIFVHIFFVIEFICAAYLFTNSKVKRSLTPLAYAFAFSLCAWVLMLILPSDVVSYRARKLLNPIFINLVTGIAMVGLIGWAAGGLKKLKETRFIAASIFVLVFGSVAGSGITLAMALLVLGYAKHETLLSTMGSVLLALSLFIYYYDMHITLYVKSLILMASGVALLFLRAFIKHKRWVTES